MVTKITILTIKATQININLIIILLVLYYIFYIIGSIHNIDIHIFYILITFV
jgi:hypothetical protein